MRIEETDIEAIEGRLLMRAIGLIMTTDGYTDKTPDDILNMLVDMGD